MRRVKRINRTEIESVGTSLFPEGWGLIAFYKGDAPLYYLPSNRLRRMWVSINKERDEEHLQQTKLQPVLTEYDSIEIYQASDALESLIIEKRLLLQRTPEYQQFIRLYDNYSYLAIDLENPPFLSSKDDTAGDLFYLGCFNDSFVVRELIDQFNVYKQTPACTGSDYPCYLYDEKSCLGYCKENEHHKLKRIIYENYFVINGDYLAKLEKSVQEDWDNLQFEKAKKSEEELQFFREYYKQLKFYGTFKHFSGTIHQNGKRYSIKQGVLESVTDGNVTETFSAINDYFSDYRLNELLAVPKNLYREMSILYNAFSEVCSEKIDEIFESTSRTLKEKFK